MEKTQANTESADTTGFIEKMKSFFSGQPDTKQEVDPLAEAFKKFQADPAPADKPEDKKQEPNPLEVYQKELHTKMSNSSFTSLIPTELMEKAIGGDAAAMMQAMDLVAKNATATAYGEATKNMEAILSKQLDARIEALKSELPSNFTKFATQQAFGQDALLSHPAVQPMVTSLSEMFLKKYPTSTPDEVKAAVVEFLKAVGTKFSAPDGNDKPTGNVQPQVDWAKMLD